jgi:hypothetical protein
MNGVTSEINSCEVCGNQRLSPVLNLGAHPMCDDLVAINDARVCLEYPIEILYCEVCRTAHQRYQVPKRELFPSTYHYRSRFTADVLQGMADLVQSCEDRFGSLDGRRVVDVGCNDGSLLEAFRKKGAATFGVEPTDAWKDAADRGHITINGFLSEAVAAELVKACGHPDFVTFTNVFAHIENLVEVLASLRCLMAPHTVLVVENHYLGAVFARNQFDTFYHEHPRTYSYESFVHIAKTLGVELLDVEFPSRYGGNIRVFLGNPTKGQLGATTDRTPIVEREAQFAADFAALRTNVERWKASKLRVIADLVRTHGPLRAKAFPGRAAILVKLLGLDTTSIAAVFEKPGSLKVGHYLPGTRIPIRSDDDLFALPDQSAPILNLAWHIPGEIREYLTAHGYTGRVVDIMSENDFTA